MAQSSKTNDPLLQPFQLKHLQLRNRIMSTSHACGLEEGGMPRERYQAYYEEKARGGIGLAMFGGSSNVAIDSPSVFQQLNVGVDEVIPHLQRLSERVHAHGAALMCQITHLGRRGESNKGAFLPTIAPSVVRETLHRSIPKEMEAHDFDRVIAAFAAAARRCQDGGLDGIETLSGAHLIGQFLSPATNHRIDAYGGSLENRCRFGLEVFEAIRKAVGDDFIVGFRFIVDEGHQAGLGFEDCVAIAKIFEASGMVDFFNAIYGRMDTQIGLAVDNMPGMSSPIAPWLDRAGAFKQEVSLPVFHAARITDIATARHAIREGMLDLVGMTRAHIADPYLVEKLEAGHEERIRPCVGATHCMSELRPACLHNPATGREAVLRHKIEPASRKRRVVVVGAGPAGLEAARVCGERGHEVVVFEAAAVPGGQVLLAAEAAWRNDIIAIADWRVSELARLGVDLRLNTFAEADDVLGEKPDLVVVATGGVPNLSWLPGHDHVISGWDILNGTAVPSDEVLVVDGTGRHVALSAAEYCHRKGARVSFAAIDESLAAEQAYSERVVWRKWVKEAGVPVSYEEQLKEVRSEGNRLIAVLQNELTGEISEVSTDQVVFDYGTMPAADVYFDLQSRSSNNGVTQLETSVAGASQHDVSSAGRAPEAFELHRIGDAVSSRNIHSAVLDALRLCQLA
ncbi:MAG: 2,4-dienoyl-CoA reductase-like NADH-dependent reductase (Old Yellow Enzyme family) [Alphaproteobacteria bacterium]|jgi:2,4-dienoyl-CoA reductase-like NADH-dependent reductase (Old Yellow Enzyme family)/thioredoxin reductase